MKNYSEIMEKCPLFAGVRREELTALLGCLQAKIFTAAKNQTVIAEGEPARYIGIVLSGAVQITRMDYDGNKSIVAEAA